MTESAEAQARCPDCGGRGWVVKGDTGAGTAVRCSCREGQQIEGLVERSGVPMRYHKCSLKNFNIGSHGHDAGRNQLVEALAQCRRYRETFLTPEGRFREAGLLFIGPPGVGKTHLAVALLVELVEAYGVRGRFVDFTSLIHEIQATFDPDSVASKRAILTPVQEAELLVLDELGAQKPSAWVSDILYLIMNTRYAGRRPTIFTTNYRLENPDDPKEKVDPFTLLRNRIPEMLVSRLYEMAKPIYMDAVGDYRREIQAHQHRV